MEESQNSSSKETPGIEKPEAQKVRQFADSHYHLSDDVGDDKGNVQNKKKNEKKEGGSYRIFISLVLLSFLAGIGGAWSYNQFLGGNRQKDLVVLDINKVVNERREVFIAKYKDKEPTPQMKEDMQKDISLFSADLTRLIEKESKNKVILLKDSVISENIKDITEDAKKQLSQIQNIR